MNQIMRDIPAGIGSRYRESQLTEEQFRRVLVEGASTRS